MVFQSIKIFIYSLSFWCINLYVQILHGPPFIHFQRCLIKYARQVYLYGKFHTQRQFMCVYNVNV